MTTRRAPNLAELPPPPPGRAGWPWTKAAPPRPPLPTRDWPRVTIVTPSFNQADYLEETIRSVLLQEYPNLEYIVIDGGSTDGSVAILERYSPWLDHWVSEPDAGQSDAINKGLSRATGEWFNWINSDDCLLPGALAAIAAAAAPGLDLICGREVVGTTLAGALDAGHTRLADDLETTLVHHRVCQQGMFFRLAKVRAVGGLRSELHYVMDLDLLARVLLRSGLGSARPLPSRLAFFRQHAAAKTHLVFPRFLHEERRLFHGLARALGCDRPLLDRILPPERAAESLPATDTDRLDRDRFSARLAWRFWWEGVIEDAWSRRDFARFRHELRLFRNRFPGVGGTRAARLAFLAHVPDTFLAALSALRRNKSPTASDRPSP